MAGNELQKDFRKAVMHLERDLKTIANGVDIVVGTKEQPIIRETSDISISHSFMEGVYIREMRMRQGSIVVGAIHKHLHMCFLLKGSVTVTDENGTVDHVAPCTIESTPGIKRILYAHEDSIWFNTHKNPSNTRDVDKLERDIVALSYKEYDEYIKNK
jgi:hypothetical protein